jgi:hypothetical protein
VNLYNPPAQGGAVSVQTDETASRAVDNTIYHNTSSVPRFVTISVEAAAGGGVLKVYCDANANPSTGVCWYASDAAVSSHIGCLSFWVLPGYYYRAQVSSGTITKGYWIEWH